MMNMEVLENRISECCSYFESIEKNSYHNKFHDYLYSSISEFLEEVSIYKKSRTIDESIKEGFDEIESLKNTDDLYKKAAIELNTLAHIFQISDQSLYDSNKQLSKLFTDEEKRYFQVSIMFARSLNIVEMSPIACLLDSYSKNFDPSKGNNPSIKEIMGLFGANIYILSVKDKVRKRSKLEIIKPSKKKDGENNFESEYDSYYSSDDDVNDIPYRPAQIKYNKESIKTTINLRKIMYHKEQISQGDIQDFQKKLKIGRFEWTHESWIAFVFCFNERMKDMKIEFNPDEKYDNECYYFNIHEATAIIYEFYPLHRIYEFWNNENKIKLFIGKNRKHAREILRAMVRGFDDADRIVTPIHMFRETYEERTPAILNLIFDY